MIKMCQLGSGGEAEREAPRGIKHRAISNRQGKYPLTSSKTF